MAVKYPVVHYACPCTDISDSHLFGAQQKSEQEEQSTFNPTSLRANYNLYFLDNLLFCNECNEIRCPRCYFDEVVTYYCPSCTLETPASVVKAESNRLVSITEDGTLLITIMKQMFEELLSVSGVHRATGIAKLYCPQ